MSLQVLSRVEGVRWACCGLSCYKRVSLSASRVPRGCFRCSRSVNDLLLCWGGQKNVMRALDEEL